MKNVPTRTRAPIPRVKSQNSGGKVQSPEENVIVWIASSNED